MSRSYRDNSYSKWEKSYRKQTAHSQRMLEREFEHHSKMDHEYALENDIEPPDQDWDMHRWGGYWRPMKRWLKSNIGKPWDIVYSKLITKLKTRFCDADIQHIKRHMKYYVEITPDPMRNKWSKYLTDPDTSFSKWDFYVDSTGILRLRKCIARNHLYLPCLSALNLNKIADWLDGRIVGYRGNKIYWFIPISKSKSYISYSFYSNKWKCEWNGNGKYGYGCFLEYKFFTYDVVYDKQGKVIDYCGVWKSPMYWVHDVKCLKSRQDKELTKEEYDFWESIPESYQNKILEWSPIN